MRSGPENWPAACLVTAAPPQSQPGTKPLGWAGDFDATATAEDPLTKEEGARDLVVVVECGVANPMALGCGSRKKPMQRNRRMKPNL
jgi:hypothetical protein